MVQNTQLHVNQFPANLNSAYQFNIETGFAAYVRTSPNQSGAARSGDYQRQALQEFASEQSKRVEAVFSDLGSNGHSIGPATRPGLIKAIQYARQNKLPIVAFDVERFCRKPLKLSAFPDVRFLTLVPPQTSTQDLQSIRQREFYRLNPNRVGGPLRAVSTPTLIYAIDRLSSGASTREIAQELEIASGQKWNHNKVRRLIQAHGIEYRCDF